MNDNDLTQNNINFAQISIEQLTESVEQGLCNPLVAYVSLKKLSDLIDDCKDSIRHLAISERMKYGKEVLVKDGFEISIVEGRKLMSYEHDSTWAEYKSALKTHEMLMSQVASGAEIIDARTGELIQPAKITYSAETLRITKAKQ